MKRVSRYRSPAAQSGAVSLLTALILVIAVTLLALFSARIVVNETRVAASDYRTSQAVEAAMAALDEGMAAFNANGATIDPAFAAPTQAQLDTLTANCTATPPTAATTNAQEVGIPSLAAPATLGLYYYANTVAGGDRCGANGEDDAGTIVAMGWSDDCSARRTISACLGSVPIFRDGNGPKQPFITGAGIGVFGNASIINRYTNISIWAGDSSAISGASFATYLRPSYTSVTDYTAAELQDNDPSNNAQLVSNRNSGFGVDVVLGDVSLANLTDNEFFGLFFAQNKQAMKDLAETGGNRLDPGTAPPPNGAEVTSGLYWIGSSADPMGLDGDSGNDRGGSTSIGGNEVYGSVEEPLVLIFNGNLALSGGVEIYGLVYVTGELKVTGTATVYGAVVSENGPNAGGGTLNIVYVPFGGDSGLNEPRVDDSGVIIPGSWRDW
jgi:hypothetical protein